MWSSHKQGELGSGETLVTNTLVSEAHQITLTATDELGITGATTISINLQPKTFNIVGHTITAGSNFACGFDITGAAYCWGGNDYGQLGDDTSEQRNTPTVVAGAHTFEAINSGDVHVVALTSTGTLYGWGSNNYGQLGIDMHNAPTPQPLSGNHTFKNVSSGGHHTVAITPAGEAYAWGHGEVGKLGHGATEDSHAPVAVLGGHTFTAASAAQRHTASTRSASPRTVKRTPGV